LQLLLSNLDDKLKCIEHALWRLPVIEDQRFLVVDLLPRLLVDLVLRLVAPLRADFDALVRLATDFFEALLADFLAALGVDFFGAAFFVALAGFLVPLL